MITTNENACQETAVFLALLDGAVFVLHDPQTLFDELCLRKLPWAEVSRLDNIREANALAFQRYGAWFYRTEQPSEDRPMALPIAGEYALAPKRLLENSSPVPVGLNPMNLVENGAYALSASQVFGGVWAFHAMNGYGTQTDLSNLVNLLLEPQWIYPCAQWYPRPENALYWSRHYYVHRFYTRFNGQSTYPIMPSMPLGLDEVFSDSYYAEREKNRTENDLLNRLTSYGMTI